MEMVWRENWMIFLFSRVFDVFRIEHRSISRVCPLGGLVETFRSEFDLYGFCFSNAFPMIFPEKNGWRKIHETEYCEQSIFFPKSLNRVRFEYVRNWLDEEVCPSSDTYQYLCFLLTLEIKREKIFGENRKFVLIFFLYFWEFVCFFYVNCFVCFGFNQ